jgi:hypothetical protein
MRIRAKASFTDMSSSHQTLLLFLTLFGFTRSSMDLAKHGWNISVLLLSMELNNYFMTPFTTGNTRLYLEVLLHIQNCDLLDIQAVTESSMPALGLPSW